MKHERKRYPDGSIYASVDRFSKVISERINTYEDLFFIKSLKDIYDHNGISDVELHIPCMFQQQHDRRFNDNESFELKLVCDFINSCNFKKVHVFHPHSDSVEMGLNNVNIVNNHSYIKKVLDNIKTNPILLSTDAGSFKWINKLAKNIGYEGEVYGASKMRDSNTKSLTQVIDRQDFNGQDVLVLDDLCVYGGTFVGLAELLKERNVGKLYLAVSHMTVRNPNKQLEKFYETVYTTNSKYDDYDLSNIEVVKIFNF